MTTKLSINRKIAVSTMSIVAALALMAGSTYALFTSQATSTGNTFSSGNASLQIAVNNDGTPGVFASSIAGANFTNLFPGFTDRQLFWLKNSSTATIDLAITADIANVDPSSSTFGDSMLISWVCDTDGNGGIADNTPTAEFSAEDWAAGGNASLGSLTPNEQMVCSLNFRVPATADNTIAGSTVSFDGIYDATQVVAP